MIQLNDSSLKKNSPQKHHDEIMTLLGSYYPEGFFNKNEKLGDLFLLFSPNHGHLTERLTLWK